MEPETKFCPDHLDVKPAPFANECMICNKPLQTKGNPDEGPAPVVVEELENTLHDPRIDGLDYPPPKDKAMIKKRLAEEEEPEFLKEVPDELHETIMAKIKNIDKAKEKEKEIVLKRLSDSVGFYSDDPQEPIMAKIKKETEAKDEPEPLKTTLKKLHEKVTAKIEKKLEAKKAVSRVKSHGEMALGHDHAKPHKKEKK